MPENENYTALEIDAFSGQETLRDFTSEEIAERKAIELEHVEAEAGQQAKKAAQESAIAKLSALGLTEEEIAAL
jgi:DNA-binding NarL/FixJ family response regulator